MVIGFSDSGTSIQTCPYNMAFSIYQMIATYDTTPIFVAFFYLFVGYLIIGWLGNGHKMYIMSRFMG